MTQEEMAMQALQEEMQRTGAEVEREKTFGHLRLQVPILERLEDEHNRAFDIICQKSWNEVAKENNQKAIKSMYRTYRLNAHSPMRHWEFAKFVMAQAVFLLQKGFGERLFQGDEEAEGLMLTLRRLLQPFMLREESQEELATPSIQMSGQRLEEIHDRAQQLREYTQHPQTGVPPKEYFVEMRTNFDDRLPSLMHWEDPFPTDKIHVTVSNQYFVPLEQHKQHSKPIFQRLGGKIDFSRCVVEIAPEEVVREEKTAVEDKEENSPPPQVRSMVVVVPNQKETQAKAVETPMKHFVHPWINAQAPKKSADISNMQVAKAIMAGELDPLKLPFQLTESQARIIAKNVKKLKSQKLQNEVEGALVISARKSQSLEREVQKKDAVIARQQTVLEQRLEAVERHNLFLEQVMQDQTFELDG
jgi:hypothetical protein